MADEKKMSKAIKEKKQKVTKQTRMVLQFTLKIYVYSQK